MPELPEVETVRRQIEPVLTGAHIERTWHDATRKFVEAGRLAGRTIIRVSRRGKYLMSYLDDGRELIIHLGMTGQLTVQQADQDWAPAGRYRVGILLRQPLGADHEWDALLLGDVRGFGRLAVREPGQYEELPTLAALGPEPFGADFNPTVLHAGLQRSTQTVYEVLLNQRLVAGLGNIYVNEACYRAGIRPRRRANSVTRPQAARLHAAIIVSLEGGMLNGGTTLRDYRRADGTFGDHQRHLLAYGRHGEACFECGQLLKRVVIGGRSASFCPTCQR